MQEQNNKEKKDTFFGGLIRLKTGNSVNNRRLGIWLTLVSVVMVACTIVQTCNSYLVISNTKYVRELLPMQIAAGVKTVETDDSEPYVKEVAAAPGDEVLVQISFRNISGNKMDTVAGRVVLPDALEFVSGSTILFNRSNPDGLRLDDGIAERWIDLGGYADYNGQERGAGRVLFRVRVSDDIGLFTDEVYILNMTCQIAGYIDGVLSSDTPIYYAAINVRGDD